MALVSRHPFLREMLPNHPRRVDHLDLGHLSVQLDEQVGSSRPDICKLGKRLRRERLLYQRRGNLGHGAAGQIGADLSEEVGAATFDTGGELDLVESVACFGRLDERPQDVASELGSLLRHAHYIFSF